MLAYECHESTVKHICAILKAREAGALTCTVIPAPVPAPGRAGLGRPPQGLRETVWGGGGVGPWADRPMEGVEPESGTKEDLILSGVGRKRRPLLYCVCLCFLM